MTKPIIRRYSKIQLPIHFVWATEGRRPFLTPEVERIAHRTIWALAERQDCTVLAVNGMADHVHLAVLFSLNISAAEFVKRVKGATTAYLRQVYSQERFIRWEPGYAAIAFPYAGRQRVIEYIRNQKEHHAQSTTIAPWEETEVWHEGELYRAGDVELAGDAPPLQVCDQKL
ncbi:MAG: IS200/IS605 family transposase [Fibrella sp.]|nr:IS200/IS605 family transposase [Armatimonadota bacterium]